MSTIAANKPTVNSGSKRRIKLAMIVVALFMSWMAYIYFGQMKQQTAVELKLSTVQKQLEDSTQESQQLQLQIDRLNDPEYIEQLATKEQGMVNPGEQQIQVIK